MPLDSDLRISGTKVQYYNKLHNTIIIHDELDNFKEAYCVEWNREEDFARHIISGCYNLEIKMDDFARYSDYDDFGRELFMYDYSMGVNNHVSCVN